MEGWHWKAVGLIVVVLIGNALLEQKGYGAGDLANKLMPANPAS